MASFDSLIIDHLNLGVTDVAASSRFYEAALAPLGLRKFFEFDGDRTASGTRIVGFGKENDRPVLWLIDGQHVGTQTHVALQAASREAVDAFHAAALAAGGTDNGQPGVRAYHPHYYGAFVIDPDGINLEAVCHLPHRG